jgi:hypothetical protein
MSKRQREIAHTVADPTLETTEVEIKGKKYTLCFDLGAIAEAEFHFMKQGKEVNLLAAFPNMSLWAVRMIFPCAIHRFHPELTFEAAQKLVTLPVLYAVWPFINLAWKQSIPEPEEGTSQTPPVP